MSVLVDTSVMVDHLRGHREAAGVLERERSSGPLLASEIARLEVLTGTPPWEEQATRSFLSAFEWCPVDEEVSERAGALGRRWSGGNHLIDSADLVVAATALMTGARLLTRNVHHFPMFEGLQPPY